MKLPGFTRNQGKGSASEILPHRSALTRLAGGDPLRRTANDYARATPSGANALDAPSIIGMGKSGTGLE